MPKPHGLIALISVSGTLACAADPTEVLPDPCPSAPYLARDQLDRDWYYRRTVVDSDGPLEGLGDLRRVRLVEEQGRLHATADGRAVASWPITRELRVTCPDGVPVEVEVEGGPLLDVEWHTPDGDRALSPAPEQTLAFAPEQTLDTVTRSAGVEFTERGALSLDPATCAEVARALGVEPPCTSQASLRHALGPVDDSEFTPRLDDGAIGVHAVGGFASRAAGVPVFYLPPEAPPELVAAAEQVAERLRAVLPGFELRANGCSPAGVAAALEATGVTGVSGPLVQQCTSLEHFAPYAFTWQRPGSLRYNTLSPRTTTSPTGWGTFAARAIDPTNGRVVAADLIVDLEPLAAIARRVRANATKPALAALVMDAEARAAAAERALPEAPAEPPPSGVDRSYAALARSAAAAREAGLLGVADDRWYAALTADPPWQGGALPPAALSAAALDVRVEQMLDPGGREAAARWMRGGHSFLPRWAHPGHGLTSATLALDPEAAAAEVVRGVTEHRLLHALLEAMGLADNPAGSSSGGASVLDSWPAEREHLATELGPYDVAALRALYLDEAPATPQTWCAIEGAMTHPSLGCAVDDWGASARASLAHAYARWSAHFPVTHEVDAAVGPLDPRDAIRPALDVFWRASLAAQELTHRARLDPRFTRSDAALDLTAAVRAGANFGAELIGLPSPGRHCPVVGTDPLWLVPARFTPGSCDPELALDDPEAIAQGQVEVPLGVGREAGLTFDRMDAPWSRVGGSVDQANALWAMTLGFPSAFEAGAPPVGLVDLVPQLEGVYDRLIESTPYFVRSSDAAALGSGWCGHAVPAQVVDVSTGAAAAPPSQCPSGPHAALQLTVTASHLGEALFLRQTVLPGRRLLLYRVGVDDGQLDWDAIEPEDICAFVDPAGDAWRSLWSEDARACALLDNTAQALGAWQARPGQEALRGVYEARLGLLDAAHRLGRLDP